MKDFYSGARRERIGNINKGKKLSLSPIEETIEKLIEKALNKSPMSDAIKHKCIFNTRPVVPYNLNGTVSGKYFTILYADKSITVTKKLLEEY